MSEKNDRMNEKRLKKCPFCGGEAELCSTGNPYEVNYHWIYCKECGCKQHTSIHIEAVIKAWNTRKPMDDIVKKMEEEYKKVQTEYSEAKYLLNEMDMKDRDYISQNYRKDMNEGMCFALDDALDIVKEEGGFDV